MQGPGPCGLGVPVASAARALTVGDAHGEPDSEERCRELREFESVMLRVPGRVCSGSGCSG
eukprot:2290693-Rhodomonas_salina.1